ncbi:copper amine oxidase [Georgenia subflava]|uniref:Copper amine oxidase n=1 Tax=Georgenia subflava TaxID=1622177 RepID=A0A6N7EKB5_9MICO|nr:copper amine oxidase [Georgenia subflava]MPV38802.1 copper amine oxidase [Georgenia subflava]
MSTIRPIRPTATLAAALALTLGLAACSGSAEEATTTSPQGEATTSESAAPTQEGMDMAEHSAVEPVSTGDPFADARTAAQHMPETAATLATGFVTALEIPGSVDSDAAVLRANLTALLQEHVYLAGIAVATAYAAGPDSAEFEAAAATLDENSVALSEAVGSLAGEEQGAAFLELWREHIGYFVDYAVAVQGGDTAARDEALADLDGYTGEAGAFFEQVSGGELPAADIASSLQMHVTTLTAAIDGLAAGSPEAYDALRAAAGHVVEAAGVLATGLATATGTEGDPNDEAATLRAELTAALQEHVYLASVAVFTAYTAEGGTDSEAFQAAAATLDANTVALSEAVGALAGEEQGDAFMALWREHIGYFVDYAGAAGDDEAAQTALTELDGYRGEAGAFFEEISAGELPADAVAEGLAMHVQTLAGAIDSLGAALVQAG